MGLFKTFMNYLLKMPVLALALGIVLVCVVALNMLDAYTPELAVVGYEGFADEEPKEDADEEEAEEEPKEEVEEEVEAEEPFSAPSKKFGGRPKGTKNHRHNRDRKQSFALGKK